MAAKQTKKRHPRHHKLLIIGGSIIGVIFGLYVVFQISPWPGALVVRAIFNRGGHKTLQGLEHAIPPQPVTVLHDQAYGTGDRETLDVYIPNSAVRDNTTLPVVIWTHGGAWLSGDKKGSAPYYSLLANQGYVVIAPNYSLAPAAQYPKPVQQLNMAYDYIKTNAERFHADTQKIVLAGDSAGAQLSSQIAATITNPSYANEVGVRPRLTPSQLAGVVLFCGIYEMEGLTQTSPVVPKIVSWGSDVSVWAYLGTRDKSSALIRQVSPYYHVNQDFPATFISGGNGDPLTDAQSKPMTTLLTSLGVPVQSLFFPADHQPKLPHEYQFKYDADGQQAFNALVGFLKSRTN